MKHNGTYIELSKDESENYLQIENQDFIIRSLSDRYKKRKGGNSSVFVLHDPNDELDYIIKFCNKHETPKYTTRIIRFNHEIESLRSAKDNDFSNVVEIDEDGYHTIDGKTYHFYTMEKGDSDLSEYLRNNALTVQQQLVLCNQILLGIDQLHSIGIYHRDIKPDNIYMFGDVWKVGDLGLISYRDRDLGIKEYRYKIGPYGWMSPEVMNKVLCEGTNNQRCFSCDIDDKSDIFQLGLIFWYIFQGNIPLGKFEEKDFLLSDNSIYELLNELLQHSKDRRPSNLKQVERKFTEILSNYSA